MDKGIKSTEELKNLVQNYQNGTPGIEEKKPEIQIQAPSSSSYFGLARRNTNAPVSQTNTQEALEKGFGTRRYDKEFLPGEDIEDRRSTEQSGLSKMTNYLGKGAVTAATTFANGTAGLVVGLLSGAYEAAFDPDNDGRHPIDAGVNNIFAGWMEQLKDWSDKAMPTYLSAEQRTEEYQKEWYKHMFTTDFAGEFLQNFGFTVGAILSGATWTKGFSLLKGKAFANNILKGAVVASEGDAAAAEELKRAYDILKKGRLTKIDGDKLTQNLKDVAKKINRANTEVQLFGATVGAMAEGDMEGIMARKEMLEDFNRNLAQKHNEDYSKALSDVINSGNAMYVIPSSDYDTETQSFRPMLTAAGREEVLRRQQEITKREQEETAVAQREGDRIASITFALNIPVLTASNMVQFGRMLSGGWKTSRKLMGVNGGINISKDAIQAAYRAEGSVPVKTVFKSLENLLSESSEEMIQGFISSGNKKYAMEKIASFNNAAYDEDSINSVRYWMENFASGGLDYLKDPKNWKEGALGGLTGLFGIPGRRWNGGVIGAYQESRDEVDASRRAAETMNKIVNDPGFRARWNGYIRHRKFDDEILKAQEKDSEYDFHTIDQKMLISDVIGFAEADRLDDLVEIANSFKEVSSSDIQNLKANLDWTDGLSNEQIIERINEQADKIITTVNGYRDMYDALSARAPIGASKAFLQELVFTAENIKAFESRFQKMLGEVIDIADKELVEYSKVTEAGQKNATEEEQKRRLEELRTFFNSVVDAFPVKMLPDQVVDSIDEQLTTLMTAANWDDATKQKIRDMRKAIADRQSFYHKLQFLQGDLKNAETGKQMTPEEAQEAFDRAAMTPEKIEAAAADEFSKEQTSDIESVADARTRFNTFKTDTEKKEFLADLAKVSKTNPAAKEYLNIRETLLKFQDYLRRSAINPNDDFFGSNAASWMVAQMFDNADSIADVHNMDDNMFPPYEVFHKEKISLPLYPASSDQYVSLKETIKKAMKQFLSDTADTQPDVSDAPVSDEKPGDSTQAGGYDAPVEASATGTPKKQEGKLENKEPEKVTIYDPDRDYPVQPEIDKMAVDLQKNDSVDVIEAIDNAEAEDKGKSKKISLHASINEISTEEAAEGRRAVQFGMTDTYKTVDLSDFLDYLDHQAKKYEEAGNKEEADKFKEQRKNYDEIWNALKDRHAFDYIATELKAGDTVEFIIDPTFPPYKGKSQVLMAVKLEDGTHQILSPLTYKTDMYYGMKELRDKIDSEYVEFIAKNPGQVFVFSKTSKVFTIKPGLIEYKWGEDSNKPIQDIPSYSEDAPIVAIIKNPETNNFEVTSIRGGESAKVAADKVIKSTAKNRYGLYYLVKSNSPNMDYVPVRLDAIRYTKDNYTQDNPRFTAIDASIKKLARILSDAQNDNYKEVDTLMRKELSNLTHLLDIHSTLFSLMVSDEAGVTLKIDPEAFNNSGSTKEAKPVYLNLLTSSEDVTYKWLLNMILKMNRHIQIDHTTTPEMLQELIDNNLLVTNAQRLRMKGVDFYCDPWSDADGEFKFIPSPKMPDAAKQEVAKQNPEVRSSIDSAVDDWINAAQKGRRKTPKQKKAEGEGVTPNPDVLNVKTQEDMNKVLDAKGALTIDKLINLDFEALPGDVKADLLMKKYDADTYDKLNDEMRKRALACAGVK